MLLWILAVLLIACSEYSRKEITYEYNGVKITRIDGDANSGFYYGDAKGYRACLSASYAGFDGSLNGYLVFNLDKSVTLVPLVYFEENCSGSKLSLKSINDNVILNKWIDSIKGRYGNILQISDVIEIERRRNKENNSEVRASYPLNPN